MSFGSFVLFFSIGVFSLSFILYFCLVFFHKIDFDFVYPFIVCPLLLISIACISIGLFRTSSNFTVKSINYKGNSDYSITVVSDDLYLSYFTDTSEHSFLVPSPDSYYIGQTFQSLEEAKCYFIYSEN